MSDMAVTRERACSHYCVASSSAPMCSSWPEATSEATVSVEISTSVRGGALSWRGRGTETQCTVHCHKALFQAKKGREGGGQREKASLS